MVSTSPLQAVSILTLTDFHGVSRAAGLKGQSTRVKEPTLLCNQVKSASKSTCPAIRLTKTQAMKRTHLRYVAFVVTAIGWIKPLCSSSTIKPRLAMYAVMAFSVICSGSKPIVAIPWG